MLRLASLDRAGGDRRGDGPVWAGPNPGRGTGAREGIDSDHRHRHRDPDEGSGGTHPSTDDEDRRTW